jgi:hypothetical protein
VRLGDTLIGPARRVLGEYADAAMLTAPEIRTSRFGADVVAVGGAALARHRLTRPLDLQGMARRADKAGRQARATNGELGLAR